MGTTLQVKQEKLIEHIHGSVLLNNDLFFQEFGTEMEHIGYINLYLSSYLVSLKCEFRELKSHTWLPVHSSHGCRRNITYIMNTDRHTQTNLQNMLQTAL